LVATSERAAYKLRREVGFVGLVFASLGSIIGAGWLFGALYASSLAGPAAIVSWLLGGGAIMLLALTHAELGGTYSVAGGSARQASTCAVQPLRCGRSSQRPTASSL
jgi:amino acid transporter